MRTHPSRFAAVAIVFLGQMAPAVWAQNTVQTIGGGGPNNLPSLKASLGYPTGVALDRVGNVYVANAYYGRIFKVGTTGNVTVVAGNGASGDTSSGDGGPAISAKLINPTGV